MASIKVTERRNGVITRQTLVSSPCRDPNRTPPSPDELLRDQTKGREKKLGLVRTAHRVEVVTSKEARRV